MSIDWQGCRRLCQWPVDDKDASASPPGGGWRNRRHGRRRNSRGPEHPLYARLFERIDAQASLEYPSSAEWLAQTAGCRLAAFACFWLRRTNLTAPGLDNQLILCKVIQVKEDRVLVDPGFYGLCEIPRDELDVSHLAPEHSSSSSSSGSGSGTARSGLRDIRPGDVVKLRLEAKATPYGDMQLAASSAGPELQFKKVWEELTQAMASRQVVQGRMLNACSGGYAVGVAGLVAFVPFTQCSSQAAANIGALQPFYVARMDAMRRLVTLQSAAHQGSLGASPTQSRSGGDRTRIRRRL